uniref:Uncharacterized protein n=1 Tax=Setaria viridis TaxID=4556 RepID=A0A4U6VF73_SETVI|nr:hypothetical protein SEVIR_3G246650v2 [Setaria viridis]
MWPPNRQTGPQKSSPPCTPSWRLRPPIPSVHHSMEKRNSRKRSNAEQAGGLAELTGKSLRFRVPASLSQHTTPSRGPPHSLKTLASL